MTEEDPGWKNGVQYNLTIIEGYKIDATTHELIEDSSSSYTEFPCKGVDFIYRYWPSYGNYCYIDYYNGNTWLSRVPISLTSPQGIKWYDVPNTATRCVISGTKARVNNVTVTPYDYPDINENTSWLPNTIYCPSVAYTDLYNDTYRSNGFMYVSGASTITIGQKYSTSVVRGWFSYYDADKQLISSTSTGGITSTGEEWNGTRYAIPEGTVYVKVYIAMNGVTARYRLILDKVDEVEE